MDNDIRSHTMRLRTRHLGKVEKKRRTSKNGKGTLKKKGTIESTESEVFTMPPGKHYVGDLSYVLGWPEGRFASEGTFVQLVNSNKRVCPSPSSHNFALHDSSSQPHCSAQGPTHAQEDHASRTLNTAAMLRIKSTGRKQNRACVPALSASQIER